eukprot:9494384-Pyramimonas_sp.AAC.1
MRAGPAHSSSSAPCSESDSAQDPAGHNATRHALALAPSRENCRQRGDVARSRGEYRPQKSSDGLGRSEAGRRSTA